METSFLDYWDKALVIEMFEEVIFVAVQWLVLLFLIIIACILVWGWFLVKEDKTERELERKHSSNERYTIFHALFEALEQKENKRRQQ